MASAALPAPYSRIALGSIANLRTEVKIMPMATVLSLLGDVAGRPQGVPAPLRHAVRGGLPHETPWILAPIFGRVASSIPHCLTPSVSVRDTDFESHLEEIAAAAGERLTGEVAALHGQEIPEHWRWALRRPNRWVDTYVAMLRAVWTAFRPSWQRAQPLLEREIARVGTASVRGVLDGVLSDLCPRWRYQDGSLLIPDNHPDHFAIGGRKLVLTPTLSGAGASIFDPDTVDMIWLGYPASNLWTMWGDEQLDPRKDSLALIVGPMRATLLRHAGADLSMNQLAGLLHCAPSVVTYHCTALVEAGLLYRQRRGRNVHMHRTVRGDALMDLAASH